MASLFLSYLTVFKSRLGMANILVGLCGFVHQPDAALLRKVKAVLDEAQLLSLDDPANAHVFQYLRDKALVGKQARDGGRYSGYIGLEISDGQWRALNRRGQEISELPTFQTDIWLAHPDVPSTIGAPTRDNVNEPFELGFQLRLLSKSKNTWTAAGQLVDAARGQSAHLLPDERNPFLLGAEGVALMRQLVATDGLLMREMVRFLASQVPHRVSRDDVVGAFPEIVERAVVVAKESGVTAPNLREAVDFLKLVHGTGSNRSRAAGKPDSGRRSASSRGPGVLEHRVSPRLEWLTDLGYLTKEGLAKNSFEYQTTDALRGLLEDLDLFAAGEDWADTVAISQWHRHPLWTTVRGQIGTRSRESAFREAYMLLRRQIGPAPLREVAFLAVLLTKEVDNFGEALAGLVTFAQVTQGATLSGGRYGRSPENIFIPDQALTE